MSFFPRWLLLALTLPLAVHAAVETWTAPNGSPMQAECLGVKGDYVVFKKTDGSRLLVPYAKLSASEKARVEGNEFKGPQSTVTIAPAKTPSTSDSNKIATALQGKLVAVNGRAVRELASDHLAGTQMYAIYYSASWCGPCRRFTPDLVAAYAKIKAAHPDFEIIFVSSDQNEDAMRHYMIDDRMPWPALRYRDTQSNVALSRYKASGIPNLVFIDGDGLILSKSYEGGKYVGPRKVLADIRKHYKM